MKNKAKIGIIGVGYVGEAVSHWFRREKYPIFLYDKYKKIGSPEEVNKAEIIFICVPTPFNQRQGYDDSAVLESLSSLCGSKIAVIKSTVLPGSTESFQIQFPQHKILFNPEFLVAKTAVRDFVYPERQIVGCTQNSRDVADQVLNILPDAPFKRIVKASEAEMIKYFGNAFLANRVIFANQMYDFCQKLGINYEVVKECTGADHRIGQSHFDIFQDGYRGYGGDCLPKDLKAFLQLAEKLGVELKLLKVIDEINDSLLKSGATDKLQKPHVPVKLHLGSKHNRLKECEQKTGKRGQSGS